jgi:hypothetical protein
MRKLTDLLRRTQFDEDSLADPGTLIDYRIHAPGQDKIDLIKKFYGEIDYPRSMRPGNFAHLSGVSEESMVFLSIWDSEENAAAAFTELQKPIDEVLGAVEGEATVQRESFKTYRFVVGDGVTDFNPSVAPIGPECVAYQIDLAMDDRGHYDLLCRQMNFPEEIPKGLLMHIACQTDFGWQTYSVWRTLEDSTAFLSEKIIPASVEVVRQFGVFPEIRPVEIETTLFALNLDGSQVV